MTELDRPVRVAVAVVVAAALACGACKGDERSKEALVEDERVELPPMSVGTAQAIGPHRFSATVTILAEPGSSSGAGEERTEVTWLDLTNYTMTRHVDGELKSQDIREGELALKRRAEGRFTWRSPRPGPDVLLKTISPFDTLIARFQSRLLVGLAEPREGDPPGHQRYTLSLTPAPGMAEGEDPLVALERATLDAGHGTFPVELSGEVRIDELGNRHEVKLEGRYRKRAGASFDVGAVMVSYVEERSALDDTAVLAIPTVALLMFAERRGRVEEESSGETERGSTP